MDNTERNAEIVRRRKAGEWPAQIARAMGLTRNTVIGACNRAGLSVWGAQITAIRKLTDAQIIELRSFPPGRAPIKALAEAWGVSRACLTPIRSGVYFNSPHLPPPVSGRGYRASPTPDDATRALASGGIDHA